MNEETKKPYKVIRNIPEENVVIMEDRGDSDSTNQIKYWKKRAQEAEGETKKLLQEIKAYRNDMVARNYPFQEISNIITRWETKKDFPKETSHKDWLKGYWKWKNDER